MKKALLLAPLAAATLALAACGSQATTTPHAAAPAKPKVLGVGDSITAQGLQGPVKLTLTGVAYPDYPDLYRTYTGPANGRFLVVSYRAQALKTPTTLGAPIEGAGFSWRGDHKTITEIQGNASNPPWVARVPEALSTQPIQPGAQAAQDYTVTLDVPRTGGTLGYQAPGGHLAGTWTLPATNTGPTAQQVDKAVAELSGGGSSTSGDSSASAPSASSEPTAPAQPVDPAPTTNAPTVDAAPGCGQRAVAAGQFNPSCSEYQGYLDPGRAGGREPSSGDLQHDWGCQQGYIPKNQC